MSFSNGLDKFINTTRKTAVKAVSGLADDVLEGVVSRTPVDKGIAASNWSIGLSPNTGFEEHKTSIQPNLNTQKSKTMSLAKTKQDLYVSNPTPYIFKLDRGHSTQAPIGIVDVTIIDLKTRRG